MWPDDRIQSLFGIELPIIQAPMEAGGLGSLANALLTTDQIREEVSIICQETLRPINLNFFCHRVSQEWGGASCRSISR
jgi:nitronate monooxygenase